MHRVVVTGIGIVAPNGIGRREFCEAIFEGRSGVDYIESFDTTGLNIKIAGEVKNFDVAALPGRAQEEPQADEPGRAVRRRCGGDGRRGRRAGDRRAGSVAIRGLHGGGDHADRRRRAGRPDPPERRRGRDVRHGPVRPGAVRVDLPALAAPAPAEHGGRAHLDPAPRDGAEQHDRDGLRGRDPGGGRGVPADRAGRRRRDAGRRLRQPARSAAPRGLLGHEGGQPVAAAAGRGLAAVRRRARRLRAGRRGRGPGCWRATSGPGAAAPRSTPRSPATARRSTPSASPGPSPRAGARRCR